ncbi:MAG: hypothetical protein ACLGH6_05840, partial [Gammaproteobacteria bacterium]
MASHVVPMTVSRQRAPGMRRIRRDRSLAIAIATHRAAHCRMRGKDYYSRLKSLPLRLYCA